MPRDIITLTTDFGTGSPYVAQMKGVLLGINSEITLVDITHEVPPQNVRQAALVLHEVASRFPHGTIHVCVVDPGVGTARNVVLVEVDRQRFIAPDNGVLSRLLQHRKPNYVFQVANPEYWLHPVSATFHGRDIMAPVAARLSQGVPPDRFGPSQERLEMLSWPVPVREGERIRGVVLSVDTFGNLITNVDREFLAGGDLGLCSIHCAGRTISELVRTYGDRSRGSLIALFGSGGLLELAVVQGSAAQTLGIGPDQEVIVTCSQKPAGGSTPSDT